MKLSGLRSRHFQPATLPPDRGVDWLAAGWRTFMHAPLVWVAQNLILIVCLGVLAALGSIGGILALVALPVLVAGLISGAAAMHRGERLGVDRFFDGLRHHAPNLLMVGVFYLVGALFAGMVAAAVATAFTISGTAIGIFAGANLNTGGLMLSAVVFSALWTLLMMALWFAPALVLLQDAAPLDAMQLSVRTCIRNLPCFGILAALLYVLTWMAMMPAGLGMLVLIPVVAGALHASYRDAFETPDVVDAATEHPLDTP